MPLPSQSARVASSGRSPMYRRSKGPSPRLIVIAVIAVAAVVTWMILPSSKKKHANQPTTASVEPITPAAVAESKPVEVPPQPPPPIVEISQGTGGRVESSLPPAEALGGVESAALPVQQPAAEPPSSPPTIDQVSSLAGAREAQIKNDFVTARILYSRALTDSKLSESESSAVREELTKINQDLVFSAKVTPGDPFVESYKVQGGDSLVRIAQRFKTGPDWRLIQRVNGMPNPNRIREGQSLKIVKGPFHAVVSKSAYRLDLYMGPTDDESKWLYIRSFTVGLGEGNSTPTGTFIVRKGSKLVDPYWVNPRTGERFDSSDPKNPIGEYWIGLEGVGETVSHVGYGIHGTIDPDSIGKQKSMGCVRLGNDDVALVYELLGEQASMVRIEP